MRAKYDVDVKTYKTTYGKASLPGLTGCDEARDFTKSKLRIACYKAKNRLFFIFWYRLIERPTGP